MDTRFKNCQSCGMPLKKDPAGAGTEADGSRSGEYCSHCYRDGRFTDPDTTAQGMQGLVRGKVRELGFPSLFAWFFAKGIPKLERWR